MPNENIALFTGQAGCQAGSSIWELLCAEHGINPDGSAKFGQNENQDTSRERLGGQSYFIETNKNYFVPRTIFSDLEYSVIDEIRSGHYRNLFHPDTLLTGSEDAANIFSRGYCSIGSLKIASFVDKIRGQMELCDSCSAILSVHSIGGGTGSGYNALQFDEIYDLYPKITKIESCIYPTGIFSTNMVEPYNAILSAHYTMPSIDVSFVMDNDALYNVSYKSLTIRNPNYTHINRLTAQIFSSMTASTRFGGPLSGNLTDYLTNLVPFPRIHFPITSFAPLKERVKLDHESQSVYNITRDVYRNDAQFCSVDVESGVYVSCCLMYRGHVSPSDVYGCIAKLKANDSIKFTEWCPTGMKVTICDMPPTTIPASLMASVETNVMLMANSSSIRTSFQTLLKKFHHLYCKRAFIHWFVGEGMEEGEFGDAINNITTLIADYDACYSMDGIVEDHGTFGRTRIAKPGKNDKNENEGEKAVSKPVKQKNAVNNEDDAGDEGGDEAVDEVGNDSIEGGMEPDERIDNSEKVEDFDETPTAEEPMEEPIEEEEEAPQEEEPPARSEEEMEGGAGNEEEEENVNNWRYRSSIVQGKVYEDESELSTIVASSDSLRENP